MSLQHTGFLSVQAAAWLLLSSAVLADVDVNAKLTVASDYMFRGVSQTLSGPALQVEISAEHDSGWYGYAWGSNVDYMAHPVPDDGARIELNFGVGYWHAIGENWAFALEAVRYINPGTHAGYDYDYTEWIGQISFTEHHGFRVGYTENIFGEDAPGTFYAFNTGAPLTSGIDLSLELGHYDLESAYGASYGYAELALCGELEFVDWRVSYFTASDSAADLFYASTVEERVVASLTFNF